MVIAVSASMTLLATLLVLWGGRLLAVRLSWCRRYHIPSPVVGGVVAAVILTLLYGATGIRLQFDRPMQSIVMLLFFASIGLGVNLLRFQMHTRAAALLFLGCATGLIVLQNVVGISVASILGLQPLVGLLAGSISLVGGYGTALAWGDLLEQQYAIQHAQAIGVASATFGLVLGGLIGGPVAEYLIRRYQLQPNLQVDVAHITVEQPVATFSIRSSSITLALLACCLILVYSIERLGLSELLGLPLFVWALIAGVLVRNGLEWIAPSLVAASNLSLFGHWLLSIYLALALLSMQLWTLFTVALPLLFILLMQTIVMVFYAMIVTFRVMGQNYDAAVIAAGHCGFGLGATPTALANMHVLSQRYGLSSQAFLIVPMVGAVFIDLVNLVVVQCVLWLF